MTTLATLPSTDEMFRALLRRDGEYEGVFVAGVDTTGIFCRPTCPARKPRPEHVRFFAGARDALLAGFRPCLRCRPLEPLGAAPAWLRDLLREVEADPARRWRDAELRALGLEPARVRRWFLREHGMTFHAFCRARRLGAALTRIGAGDDLLEAGYDAGWESPSGFREAFGRLFGDAPGRLRGATRVVVRRLLTPLGVMLAGATDEGLCLLEFADRRMLETQVSRLRRALDAVFVQGDTPCLAQVERELGEYFAGARRTFDVPLVTPGSPFQRAAWAALLRIPCGETRTYAEQARALGRPGAARAVGRANGDNRLAIVIPCHRVVGADGGPCGYGGQVWRKRALLDLEQGRGRG
ncbi:MAG: methylated-DNA--[protein]-cysteine S-methyltransferase [Planctomycetes bacterium]|nr:methylated-DNA--[protein]-cysteine S-methyltransferase [Planctomycetota bacterium]